MSVIFVATHLHTQNDNTQQLVLISSRRQDLTISDGLPLSFVSSCDGQGAGHREQMVASGDSQDAVLYLSLDWLSDSP